MPALSSIISSQDRIWSFFFLVDHECFSAGRAGQGGMYRLLPDNLRESWRCGGVGWGAERRSEAAKAKAALRKLEEEVHSRCGKSSNWNAKPLNYWENSILMELVRNEENIHENDSLNLMVWSLQ